MIIAIIYSCNNPNKTSDPSPTDAKGVLIINEGNFQRGNATLTKYEIDGLGKENVVPDIFNQVNKRPLGDVAQSITLMNNELWVVVNNSGKIEVMDTKSYQSIGTISGFNSPRYILPINKTKCYISDLYDNQIAIINPETKKSTGTIPCKGWTEKMILVNKTAYVTNLRDKYLLSIDTETDKIMDSISIGINAHGIVMDKNNHLWVICGGNSLGKNEGSGLYCIDPETHKLLKKIPIESLPIPPYTLPDELPTGLSLNATRDTLYYLNHHVYSLGIESKTAPTLPLIKGDNRSFYSMGCNPKNNQIWVSDAKDYVQQSEILIYQSNGTFKTSFKAGIISGQFYFE